MNRTMLALALGAALALAASDARAQSEEELVSWLNAEFGSTIWPMIQRDVAAFTVSELVNSMAATGGTVDLSRTRIDLARPPTFSLAPDGILARLPGTGDYTITTRIVQHVDVFPDAVIDATVRFQLSSSIETYQCRTATGVSVEVNLSGYAFVPGLGPILQSELQRIIRERVQPRLERNLGMLARTRFDPSSPLETATPEFELVSGPASIDPRSAIDVVIVADGYGPEEMGDFDVEARAIASQLTLDNPVVHDTEPFRSFRSILRVHKMNALMARSDVNQLVLASFADPQSATLKATFGNLARLARIRVRTRARGADLVVFLGRPRMDGVGTTTRAAAFGTMVLLPWNETAGSTLLHELGHTVLGSLGDEYVEGALAGRVFRGHEPSFPNVAIDPRRKFAAFIGHPERHESWDLPVSGVEGCLYHGRGVFRPAQNCKMRQSIATAFCAVCRDAVTRGIRGVLGPEAVHFSYEILAPWAEGPVYRTMPMPNGEVQTLHLEAYDGPAPTRVRVRVLGSTLPEPWTARWTVAPDAGSSGATLLGLGHEPPPFDVALGGRIELELESTTRFTTGLPTFRGVLQFDVPRRPGVQMPPRNLGQTLAPGASLALVLDRSSGRTSLDLALFGTTPGVRDWTVETALEFRVVGPTRLSRRLGPGPVGFRANFSPGHLEPGRYAWEVRTVHGEGAAAVGSPWVSPRAAMKDPPPFDFEVLGPELESEPVAPAAPGDLGRSLPSPSGGPVVLWARSWDANGDCVRLQFELKPVEESFDGSGLLESDVLARLPGALAGTGTVRADSPPPGTVRWRVRAVDETGLVSNWTGGGSFAVTIFALRDPYDPFDILEGILADDDPGPPPPGAAWVPEFSYRPDLFGARPVEEFGGWLLEPR